MGKDAKAFFDAVSRLKYLTEAANWGPVEKARSIPFFYERTIANKLGTTVGDSDEEKSIVAAVAGEAKAKARSLGEFERDFSLLQVASEIEALRAILPELAAKASIDLGAFAREILK